MNELMLLQPQDDSLYNEIIKENLDKRILVFNGGVDDTLIENYALYILKWNAEDKDIPVDKRKPITILINSGGGECIVGHMFCSLIMESKTPIRTVCLSLAASMAYHIYLAADYRYAFKGSILLQHDGEIQVSNSTSKAKQTMQFFDDMEKRTKEYVLSRTNMTEEFYDKIYEQEFYMYANTVGKELGIVHYIIGEDCDLDEIL